MPPRVLPHRKWFLPDAYHHWRFRRALQEAVDEAQDVLHVADGDLDGAGCDVLLRMARGPDRVGTFYSSPYDLVETLEGVADADGDGRELVVSDLSFNHDEAETILDLVARIRKRGWSVTWRDHHQEQWDDEAREGLEELGVTLSVHEDGELCTADMVRREEGVEGPFAEDLASLVRDHDLWLREDPWSEVLSDACAEMGARDLAEHLLETRDARDPAFEDLHEEVQEGRERDAEWGRDRATFRHGDQAVVAVTYGSGPTNTTLHRLMEDDGAHLAVMLRPEGSFSLRSRDDVEVCHLVAQAFDGGGHPNASGGTLGLRSWEYPRYWLLQADDPRAKDLAEAAIQQVDAHLA